MMRGTPVFDDVSLATALMRAAVRRLLEAAGLLLLCGVGLAAAALATWSVDDPSLSNASGGEPANLLGYSGAVMADLMLQGLGLAAMLLLLPPLVWSTRLFRHKTTLYGRAVFAWLLAAPLAAGAVSALPAPASWPLPIGLGGFVGDLLLARLEGLLALPLDEFATTTAAIVFATFAFGASWTALQVPVAPFFGWLARDEAEAPAPRRTMRDQALLDEEDDEEDGESRGRVFLGACAHALLSAKALARRPFARRSDRPDQPQPSVAARLIAQGRALLARDEEDGLDPAQRIEPVLTLGAGAATPARPHVVDAGYDEDHDPDEDVFANAPIHAAAQGAPAEARRPAPRKPAPVRPASDGRFLPPSLELLAEPKAAAKDATLSPEALQENARELEGVLEDFGVRGEITQVRPGPVVTLYELEPAPGTKSARVISLADDIARSMSAISARVAVIPGRNAIGVELPNEKRQTVFLREQLASDEFTRTKARLALCLGKTIGGEPVIADLARMPHLLVAGTTGSGKSVAINTMVLSLLYRLTPQECRLIMIDPKMLELSVYDGIPHLLAPVVTDPKKAVVALKWAVREMEDRYRNMSKLGVRNIDGFNSRVKEAQEKGETLSRTVQTGFDRDTGEAVYETEELDLEPMPFIVVIIDEMADLMMVAGKEIEGAVQRLAQMARAAGIHVVMATQRPSVDVITGTIKANFPTRISFQVTSKIDSRTILGEQGAEQLLGQGDMLYMMGGGRIRRVHGPFVSDEEVEDVVAHLKAQGVPDYLDAVTRDEEDGDTVPMEAGLANLSESNDLYDQAVAVVLRDKKASTSYVQRRLGIGYNRAASLIERMEKEGVISGANHAGKREILVDNGDVADVA
jgi:S-DNA-T family DNA segregation ATPase FtsK/SpoIIIE